MSKTLVCLSETLPFYAQDVCKEKSFNYDTSADTINKNKTEKKTNIVTSLLPQDENKYANQQHDSVDQTLLKRNLSKKREATNILMECVKRRENMQNVEFNSYVPFEFNNVSISSGQQISDTILQKELSGQSVNKDSFSIDLSPMYDSGINSCESNSPVHSEDASAMYEEDKSNIMEVDQYEEIKDVGNLSPKSTVISVELNNLNLEESSLQSSSTTTASAKSPLINSIFKTGPPMLYFSTKDEIVEPLPSETLSVLKWKLSTITPVLIREMVLKCGFLLLEAETTDDWVGTWGKHLKVLTFRKLKSFQKVNHYPGGFHLGRKDKLWSNIRRMQTKYGKEKFGFFPDSYVLPGDLKLLKKIWDEESDICWITKPCASARGTGVKVIHKWSQVPKTRPAVVQRYISDPYLINGSKFDLRIYVLVPSINPLRIYVYQDGLVRFASEKYSLSNKSFGNRYVHLTNYSINKRSSTYTSNEDESLCQGHKWSLKSFWSYMSESGIDVDKIKSTIVDMIIKTVISSEGSISRLMKLNTGCSYNCFELFGFDIMLDKELKPWLLEVNISPSLHTKSTLDLNVKGPLVKDMMNIAGFEIPTAKNNTVSISSGGNRHQPPVKSLSLEEKKKHAMFSSKYASTKANILESLTFDDISCLMESEDEYSRCGSFVRVFPTDNSYKYFVYFQRLGYYNVLLDAWEQTFHNDRNKGIAHIEECYEKLLELQISQKDNLKESSTETKVQESEDILTVTAQ